MPRKYVESFEFCLLALSHRLDQISVLIGDGIDATLHWCVCEHLLCVCVSMCSVCVCVYDYYRTLDCPQQQHFV